jgi:aspartyl-tRNA(Asn)/glutamyl-tRNA(Gln) amidotransferase subunit A
MPSSPNANLKPMEQVGTPLFKAGLRKLVADLLRLVTAQHGPLLKTPLAVKDNIATKDYPTTCGSKILQTYQSPFDATVVKSLTRRRFIMGKTNLDEFGMGSHSTNSFFGPVLGIAPLRRHSVGGSSGGSAVAVATGQCINALGTDTGGSVRLPAAYTGIVGFKPSYGRLSRWGVIPYANSLDTVGVLGSSIRAVTAALPDNLLTSDTRDPTSLKLESSSRMDDTRRRLIVLSSRKHDPRKIRDSPNEPVEGHLNNNFAHLKIGIPVEYNIAELDPVVKEEWQYALGLLQELGCTLVPISLPNTRHALSAYYVIAAAEAASNLAKYDGVRYGTRANSSDGAGDVLYSNTRGSGFGDEVKRRILLGSYSLSSKAIDNYFIKAQKVRRLVQRDFDRVFRLPNLLRDEEQYNLSDMDESVQMDSKLGPPQVDFIVCPTAPTLPPTRNATKKQLSVESYTNDVFTVPSSLAGLPAISLPFKLPGKPGFAGIQIIGQYSDDFRLLTTATALVRLQKRKASLIEKHGAPRRPMITKYHARRLRIRKHLSRLSMQKYLSRKGENRLREPRTEKEVNRFVGDAFENWESLMSGKKGSR